MAGEMFGVPIGLRAYQDDQVKLGALASQTRQANSAAALADAQVANLAADNARLDKDQQLKIDALKEEKALQAELARIASGDKVDGGDTPKPSPLAGGSKFDTLLDRGAAQVAYLQSRGRVKEASELLAKLSNGVKDLAQARQAVSAAQENATDTATKRHEFTGRTFAGVTDQASYDQARMAAAASGLYTPEDLQEIPVRYSPRFVAKAIAGSEAAKRQADIAREASRTAMQNKNDQDQIKARELAQNLAERTHTLAVEREARLKKEGENRATAAGLKGRKAPNTRELTAVTAELKRIGLKVETDMTAALKNDIAEEVLERVRANTGLSWGEAASVVVAEMRADGRIEESMIGADKYKPDGKTASRALPLPTSKDALQANTYYTINGETRLFDGTGWKAVQKKAGAK